MWRTSVAENGLPSTGPDCPSGLFMWIITGVDPGAAIQPGCWKANPNGDPWASNAADATVQPAATIRSCFVMACNLSCQTLQLNLAPAGWRGRGRPGQPIRRL